MVDALHGWESGNLDLMNSKKWIDRVLSKEWFRANQIEDQTNGSDDQKRADACESGMEGTETDDGKGSGP